MGRGRRGHAASTRRREHLRRLPRRTRTGRRIFLCAHTDTVPPEAAIEPVVEDGVVRNAAGTILGSDNKAAVVVDARGDAAHPRGGPSARRHRARLHAEGGGRARRRRTRSTTRGSSRARRLRLRPGRADRRDRPRLAAWAHCSTSASTGGRRMRACRPEEGRSAIAAASRAIADFRLGRVDEETSANVGVISGGTAPERRARVVHVPGGGALARRAEGDRARARDARDGGRSPRASRSARSRPRFGRATPATASARATSPYGSRRRRSSAPASSRRTHSAAAAARTRTSSTRAASRA